MFDVIWNALEDDLGVREMSHIVEKISHMSEHFVDLLEEDYFKDENAKNAVIDAICQILQEYKDGQEDKIR